MDDAQRDAYEERREDERRQEREREEAYRDELMAEDSRRLARYDEAIRLLRKWVDKSVDWPHGDTTAFLTAEPAPEKESAKFPLKEVTPEEAQRRYLRSMKGSGE